jgi:hypothetical protein
MQNCTALNLELQALSERAPCSKITIALSSGWWNPISAVILNGLRLPSVITPQTIDLRIPIPNLYGFAVSAGIGVTSEILYERADRGLRPVPFCSKITERIIDVQTEYYVDVRENSAMLMGQNSICVTPAALPPYFIHLKINDFLSQLLEYLSSPSTKVKNALSESEIALQSRPNDPFLWLRVAHLYEGLQEYSAALEYVERAILAFPKAEWFKRKEEYLRDLLVDESY